LRHPQWVRLSSPLPILEKCETEGSLYSSTACLWDDGILDPAETRRVFRLAMAASLNASLEETRCGVLRM